MAGFDPRKSLALWKAREAYRKRRHTAADKAGDVPRRDKWKALLLEARAMVARRRAQIGRPLTVVTKIPARTGGYGSLGPIRDVTVHHDAAVIDPDASMTAIESRLRSFDRQHSALYGGGGIGYHEAIDPQGRVWLLRRSYARGAHTGGQNTGNYGQLVMGNFENQKPTEAQLRTLRRRLTEAPPKGLPDLRGKRVRGHQDWPGPTNATLCPGKNLIPTVKGLPRYAG